eukprot:Lithocolla_globosa_v1_NODE_3258_length_1717_cov_7.506619.p3 type:complete len:101 gc:universal NODE_3258_length_1717_cov_7.506619:867-565(-)
MRPFVLHFLPLCSIAVDTVDQFGPFQRMHGMDVPNSLTPPCSFFSFEGLSRTLQRNTIRQRVVQRVAKTCPHNLKDFQSTIRERNGSDSTTSEHIVFDIK